jgi:hypothetical protein
MLAKLTDALVIRNISPPGARGAFQPAHLAGTALSFASRVPDERSNSACVLKVTCIDARSERAPDGTAQKIGVFRGARSGM